VDPESYTFVIVDDEPEIREGIRDNVPWESLGFRFAGACADGAEALELIERDAPDVVMTDINMPFMDGLTLAERIQSLSPATKVLILTGFDDFEYARKALKLQVHDFILKPLTPSEFKATLEKLKATLDEEHGERRDIERLKRQLAESLPLLRERFLNQLVSGTLRDGADRAERLGIPFPSGGSAYHAAVIDFDRRPERADFDLDLIAERNVLERVLEESASGNRVSALAFQDGEDRMVVVSWGDAKDGLFREALKAAEAVRTRLFRAGFASVSIGLGDPVDGVERLSESYRGALDALALGQVRGGGSITTRRELTGRSGPDRERDASWGKIACAAIRTASLEPALKAIDEMAASFRAADRGVDEYRRTLRGTLAAVVQLLDDLEIPEREIFEGSADPFVELRELKTPDLARSWFRALVERIVSYLRSRQENFAQAKAREAAEYIESRYEDPDLSLPALCKDLYISTSYFSSIFKKFTEKTFVEYLTEVRIEKAKELLRTSGLKSYEVAERVGYRDAHYFSLSFRKAVGETPTRYRSGQDDEQD